MNIMVFTVEYKYLQPVHKANTLNSHYLDNLTIEVITLWNYLIRNGI